MTAKNVPKSSSTVLPSSSCRSHCKIHRDDWPGVVLSLSESGATSSDGMPRCADIGAWCKLSEDSNPFRLACSLWSFHRLRFRVVGWQLEFLKPCFLRDLSTNKKDSFPEMRFLSADGCPNLPSHPATSCTGRRALPKRCVRVVTSPIVISLLKARAALNVLRARKPCS